MLPFGADGPLASGATNPRETVRLSDFQVLTFDCYGTLIDWETGILRSLASPLRRSRRRPEPEAVLEEFARAESWWERREPSAPYPEILGHACSELCASFGVEASEEECAHFGDSVGSWPAFADSAAALSFLKDHFRLVVLSNVDRSSFAASKRRLGVEFDAIYTAEDVGSYKPDPRNFRFLIEGVRQDLGLTREAILHTAQSLYHDHVPAAAAGLATCWIDRRRSRSGWGATPPPESAVAVDFSFVGLAEMAAACAEEVGDKDAQSPRARPSPAPTPPVSSERES